VGTTIPAALTIQEIKDIFSFGPRQGIYK